MMADLAFIKKQQAIVMNMVETNFSNDASSVMAESIATCVTAVTKSYKEYGFEDSAALFEAQYLLMTATRHFVHSLIEKKTLTAATAEKILNFSIIGVENGHANSSAPFILLEDIFEAAPVSLCKILWNVLEKMRDRLTQDFTGKNLSQMILLRTINSVKGRLSEVHDTEFSGQVQMFAAQVFPLCDKSGLNLTCEFNEDNVTVFEEDTAEADAFLQEEPGQPSSPGSEPSPKKKKKKKKKKKGESGDDKSSAYIDYPLYRSFWSLQQHFANPHRILEKGSLPSRKDEFLQGMESVLGAFEARSFSDADIKRAQQEEATDGDILARASSSSDPDSSSNCGVKYLTKKSLFRLQLRDPHLRREVLLQCLIVFDYLRRPDPKAKEAKIPPQFTNQLESFQKRVRKLLERTPPAGQQFTDKIRGVLSREESWARWKDNKCPNYDKDAEEAPFGGYRLPMRRKAELQQRQLIKQIAQVIPKVPSTKEREPKINAFLAPLRRSLEQAKQMRLSADKRKVYDWRGLRLFAHQHVSCLDLKLDADANALAAATTKLYEIAAADKDKTESGAAPAKKIKIDGRNSAKRKAETKEETTNAKQRKIEK